MASGRSGSPTKERAAALGLGLAGLFGSYLILVLPPGGPEYAAGAVAAGLATLAAASVAADLPSIRPRVRWLFILPGRVPIPAVRDAFRVLGALVGALASGRRIEGETLAVPFDVGGDDPESEARRALVMAGASVAPNTVVVALDRDKGRMVVHRLLPGGTPPGRGDREWPL